jgi:hypothetical protein
MQKSCFRHIVLSHKFHIFLILQLCVSANVYCINKDSSLQNLYSIILTAAMPRPQAPEPAASTAQCSRHDAARRAVERLLTYSKVGILLRTEATSCTTWAAQSWPHTPPRSSEISMKNLWYKAMLKVWRKLWEPFRIYQLTSTANPAIIEWIVPRFSSYF